MYSNADWGFKSINNESELMCYCEGTANSQGYCQRSYCEMLTAVLVQVLLCESQTHKLINKQLIKSIKPIKSDLG